MTKKIKEDTATEKVEGHTHRKVERNPNRSLTEIKTSTHYVEKQDGINIDAIVMPHDLQIGLDSEPFVSNLLVKGKIKGSIHKTQDGEPYLIQHSALDILYDDTTHQIKIPLKPDNTPSNGQVLAYDATLKKVIWKTVSVAAVMIMFSDDIQHFTVADDAGSLATQHTVETTVVATVETP